MIRPLYKANHAPDKFTAEGNAGLWFERFFSAYEQCFKGKNKKETKEWMDKLKVTVGNEELLRKHASYQLKMIDDLDGKLCTVNCSWHFVTGMGNPHPVENGFTWHPTLGVPYLPGSAVKGLLRSWIEQWDEKDDKKRKEKLLRWFGSDHKNPKQRTNKEDHTGELIFFDALPIEKPRLSVDIMTPHMGKWYEKGGDIKCVEKESEAIPADWHDPVPVPYLVTDKATFLFSIALRACKKTVVDALDLDEVMQALKNALEWLGAGAKTAVGYGQMQEDEQTFIKELKEKQKKLLDQKQFEEEIKDWSPLAKKFVKQAEQEKWNEDKNKFWAPGVVEGYLDELEKECDIFLVIKLEKLLSKHFPKKKKKKPKEREKKVRERLCVLRENNTKKE
ncbi:type III-B CRISPR module RAMP protein Cmr6 [bacterium]|nr:type III-B CRISPR module RAMP protein Cmr6 [bacterium]